MLLTVPKQSLASFPYAAWATDVLCRISLAIISSTGVHDILAVGVDGFQSNQILVAVAIGCNMCLGIFAYIKFLK